jgi:hypothetical protein
MMISTVFSRRITVHKGGIGILTLDCLWLTLCIRVWISLLISGKLEHVFSITALVYWLFVNRIRNCIEAPKLYFRGVVWHLSHFQQLLKSNSCISWRCMQILLCQLHITYICYIWIKLEIAANWRLCISWEWFEQRFNLMSVHFCHHFQGQLIFSI